MIEVRAMTEVELATAVRTGMLPADVTVQMLAHELVRARHRLGQESRSAEQLKKLRWTTEHTLTKIEELHRVEADQARTAEAIALWLDGLTQALVTPAEISSAIRDGRWR